MALAMTFHWPWLHQPFLGPTLTANPPWLCQPHHNRSYTAVQSHAMRHHELGMSHGHHSCNDEGLISKFSGQNHEEGRCESCHLALQLGRRKVGWFVGGLCWVPAMVKPRGCRNFKPPIQLGAHPSRDVPSKLVMSTLTCLSFKIQRIITGSLSFK